jgi:hypothetical protein
VAGHQGDDPATVAEEERTAADEWQGLGRAARLPGESRSRTPRPSPCRAVGAPAHGCLKPRRGASSRRWR